MTITPENLQKIQQHLQEMQQAVEAATAALKDDPTSPEYLAKLQQAMAVYSSSVGLAAATITKLEADLQAIGGKL